MPDGTVLPWTDIDYNPKQQIWQQVHVHRLVKFLRDNSDAPSAHILAYLLENKNADNLVIATVREMAEDIGVNPLTVQRVMKKMFTNDDVRKVRNGVYQINPDIISYGQRKYTTLREDWRTA